MLVYQRVIPQNIQKHGDLSHTTQALMEGERAKVWWMFSSEDAEIHWFHGFCFLVLSYLDK